MDEAEVGKLLRAIQDLSQCRLEHLDRFARLVQDCIYGWVRFHAGQDADASEVTQQTLTSIIGSIATYDSSRPAIPWMREIARNAAIRVVEKRKRAGAQGGDPGEEFKDQEPGVVEMVIREDQLQQLQHCIDALHATYRVPIVLRYYEELDHNRIGFLLGISEDAAKQRVSRAYGMLRTCLQQAGHTD